MSKQTNTSSYQEVSRQEFLQELCLLVLNSFDDELIVTGDVEDGTTCSRVGQLNQVLVTQGVLHKHTQNMSNRKHYTNTTKKHTQ